MWVFKSSVLGETNSRPCISDHLHCSTVVFFSTAPCDIAKFSLFYGHTPKLYYLFLSLSLLFLSKIPLLLLHVFCFWIPTLRSSSRPLPPLLTPFLVFFFFFISFLLFWFFTPHGLSSPLSFFFRFLLFWFFTPHGLSSPLSFFFPFSFIWLLPSFSSFLSFFSFPAPLPHDFFLALHHSTLPFLSPFFSFFGSLPPPFLSLFLSFHFLSPSSFLLKTWT